MNDSGNIPGGGTENAAVVERPRTHKDAFADSLPFDPQAEKNVLSAILIDGSNMSSVLSVLGTNAGIGSDGKGRQKNNPEGYFHRLASVMFREPVHVLIYEAMLCLNANNQAIDTLSVADHLRRQSRLDQIGGEMTLLQLQNEVVSTSNLEAWCHLLKDYAMLREMMRMCSSSLELCRSGARDVKQILDSVEANIYGVRNAFVQPEIRKLSDVALESFEYLKNVFEKKIDPGIPTGFTDLDKMINGGLKPSEMFVLAARPSIGKTALALNIVRNIILKECTPRHKVAFFSLEMSDQQIVNRLLSTESGIPLSAFFDGSFQAAELPKLTKAVSILRRCELFIDSTPGLSVYELRAKVRKLRETEKIDLVVIDYLQLMHATGREESRQVEVSAISGGIKAVAKELNIPILVLAQLSRESEKQQGGPKQADPLPKLSHLRESGAIEQDADVVCFIHRNRDKTKEGAAADPAERNKAYLIVEKNRNGKTGIVEIAFKPELMQFGSIDRSAMPPQETHKYGAADAPQKKA